MYIPNEDPELLLHLRGKLNYFGNPKANFSNIIKRGLRLVMWGNSERSVTSCVFIEDLDMRFTHEIITEIIIFSGRSIDKVIAENETYRIGIPGTHMADFTILEIKGKWIGLLPQFDS